MRQARRPGDVDRSWRQGRIHRHHRLAGRPGPRWPASGPGLPGIVPHQATKGALATFARGLSNEVAGEGIRVNSVSPGIIDTGMAYPETQEVAAHSPRGRIGQPDEIAAAVSWLISPQASFITGSDITVAGGL